MVNEKATDKWCGSSFVPRTCLDLFPLLPYLFGIAFHLQLVLLSYHPIFLRPYHFLKLVSFLGANWTKSASVCPWLLRGAIQILKYNTILYILQHSPKSRCRLMVRIFLFSLHWVICRCLATGIIIVIIIKRVIAKSNSNCRRKK